MRHLLRQMVEGIVCDFDFDKARSSEKRKRYRFAGAEIVLRSSELETPLKRGAFGVFVVSGPL
ncbi:MAG: hypothetical protein IH831_06970 [Planctomycetes bacterium]|nr:hypothetical protein [Planctomycetota bacterium]